MATVWQKQASIPLQSASITNGKFDDIYNYHIFPKCIKPLHIIWKLSGFTWSGNEDVSSTWIIWSWIYRLLVIAFFIAIFLDKWLHGALALALYINDSKIFIVRFSMVMAVVMYELCSIYPLIFCAYYLHKGHLHKLLQNITSSKYVQSDYISDGLYDDIYNKSKQCLYFTIFCVITQWIGWIIVQELTFNDGSLYWSIFASIFWPFCWAMFKVMPFCSALTVLIIVIKILRIQKDLYISSIAVSHQCFDCNNNASGSDSDNSDSIFSDIDTSKVEEIKDIECTARHLHKS